jgi:hypothetical protein
MECRIQDSGFLSRLHTKSILKSGKGIGDSGYKIQMLASREAGSENLKQRAFRIQVSDSRAVEIQIPCIL